MKNLRAAYQDALDSGLTTLCYCVRIERTDGVVFRFTDHDRELEMGNGAVYVPDQGGADTSAIRYETNGQPATMDLEGALTVNGISREAIAAGLFDHATVYLFRTLWDDPLEDDEPLAKGYWGKAELRDHSYQVEWISLSSLLDQRIGRVHSHTCDADLGDSRCKVNLANFTHAGTVTAVTDRATFSGDTGQPDDYYGSGLVTFTSGANAGIAREVATYTGGQFGMWQAFPFAISIGDTFDAQAGCRKRFEADCGPKFDNQVNFQGFPFIPGERVVRQPGGV